MFLKHRGDNSFCLFHLFKFGITFVKWESDFDNLSLSPEETCNESHLIVDEL